MTEEDQLHDVLGKGAFLSPTDVGEIFKRLSALEQAINPKASTLKHVGLAEPALVPSTPRSSRQRNSKNRTILGWALGLSGVFGMIGSVALAAIYHSDVFLPGAFLLLLIIPALSLTDEAWR